MLLNVWEFTRQEGQGPQMSTQDVGPIVTTAATICRSRSDVSHRLPIAASHRRAPRVKAALQCRVHVGEGRVSVEPCARETVPLMVDGQGERSVRVIGVDGCRKGWVGLSCDLRGYFGATIGELIAAADADGILEVIAIDIPIGLPTAGMRQADALARREVGRRASSVFSTPVRAALAAASHREASAINTAATGKGLSQQAYALGAKILEVDDWVLSEARRVIEIHPEVSFARMAGRTMAHPKATWAGSAERREVLARTGIVVPAGIGRAGEMAGVDDVLDAAAACWTAGRFAKGLAVSLPASPEDFGDGHLAGIWA
jgi:predicted RNase H-like nuclease